MRWMLGDSLSYITLATSKIFTPSAMQRQGQSDPQMQYIRELRQVMQSKLKHSSRARSVVYLY